MNRPGHSLLDDSGCNPRSAHCRMLAVIMQDATPYEVPELRWGRQGKNSLSLYFPACGQNTPAVNTQGRHSRRCSGIGERGVLDPTRGCAAEDTANFIEFAANSERRAKLLLYQSLTPVHSGESRSATAGGDQDSSRTG